MVDHNNLRIALVGGGAASVVLVHEILKKVQNLSYDKEILISVFDHKEVGHGLAYQADVGAFLLNVRAKAMNIAESFIGGFTKWCGKQIPGEVIDDNSYVSRFLFGKYLNALFKEIVKEGMKSNVVINHIQEEVVHIKREGLYYIETNLGRYEQFDYVVLCIGSGESDDPYYLKGFPRYIHNPYPFENHAKNINKNEKIAILGCGLTAIDLVIGLIENGHQEEIHLYSRRGILPTVRGEIIDYQMRFMHPGIVNHYIENDRHISIKTFFNILKSELKLLEVDLLHFFTEKNKFIDPIRFIEMEIEKSRHVNKLQSFMIATNQCIEAFWHVLRLEDKKKFLNQYHAQWMSMRAPIPAKNALKILSYLKSGQLKIYNSIRGVKKNAGQFMVLTYEKYAYYDCIFNAIGASRNVYANYSRPLIRNLFQDRYISAHPLGGIKIDFDTASVINSSGFIDFRLKAIGHITCGTYYYTSSFPMIVAKSKQLVSHLIH